MERWHIGELRCEKPGADDFPFYRDLFSLPELSAHKPDPRPDSPDILRSRFDADMAHWESHQIGRWCVHRDGRQIGFCGLTVRSDYPGLNISYHLDPVVWRQGVASCLVAGMVALAEREALSFRLYGLVRPVNAGSRRVLEKAGFREKGEVVHGGHPSLLMARDIAAPG